jgi:FkbM family methyltransferase
LLSTNLRAGDTAIDVGAHCGQYAILMAALCGTTGRVVAFEPDPHARKMLLQNLQLNPGIKSPVVEAYAVADAEGEALLYSRGGNSQSSLARSGVEFSAADKSDELRVRLISLDSYLCDRNRPNPHWVKSTRRGGDPHSERSEAGAFQSRGYRL